MVARQEPRAPLPLQLNQEQLQLLRPVAARGQRETKKQALRRALQLERAGVSLPSSVRLYQERQRPQTPPPGASSEEDDGADSDGSGSSSDGEDPTGGVAARPASKKQRTLPGETKRAAGHPAQAAPVQQQQQPKPPTGESVDEQEAAARRKQQADELRRAARDAKLELGVSDRQDDDEDGRPSARGPLGRQAAPAGKPRVVLVERRPEIQAVRWVIWWTGALPCCALAKRPHPQHLPSLSRA